MGLKDRLRSCTNDLTGFFVYLLLTSTLGPLLFGYHLAELNAPQDVITCNKSSRGQDVTTSTLPQCFRMNSTQFGLVSSIFTLGGLIGALAAGSLSTCYGRIRPMRFTTAFATAGPIGEALSPNIGTLVAGRFVSGLGAGACLVVVPIYISEIAPPGSKGLFGSFTQIMTNMGIFITQLLGYFLSHDQMWRVILAVAGAIGLLQLFGLSLAVESPKWLVDHDDSRKAKAILQRIRGENVDLREEIKSWRGEEEEEEEQTLLDDEESPVRQITNSNDKKKMISLGILEVLYKLEHSRAVIAVMMVMVAQQLCGINSIIMYGVSLLADLLKSNSALLNVFVSILNIVVTTACAPLSDILGRKVCLLASIAGMGTSSILLAVGIRAALPLLSAIAVLLFVAAFGLGLGPIPFILSSELVGPEAVGATQSWALAANWISTFIVAQFFPLVNEKLGKGVVYFIFAGLAAMFFVLVLLGVPETKGKKNADEVWGRDARRTD